MVFQVTDELLKQPSLFWVVNTFTPLYSQRCAVSAGGNVKAVQRMLGHSTASQTLDRYSHLFTSDLEALAERLDEVFSQQNASYTRPLPSEDVVELVV